ILVSTDVISEAELLDNIEHYRAQTVAAAEELGRTINERIFGVKRKPVATPPATPVAAPTAPKPAPVTAVPTFAPAKVRVHTLRGHTAPIVSLAFLAHDRTLVSIADDGTVKFWNAETGEPLRTLSARPRTGAGAAVSPDGRWLALPGENHMIHLWDIQEDKPAGALAGHTDAIDLLVFSPDGQRL